MHAMKSKRGVRISGKKIGISIVHKVGVCIEFRRDNWSDMYFPVKSGFFFEKQAVIRYVAARR